MESHKTCQECLHAGVTEFQGRQAFLCNLKNLIPYSDIAYDCRFYNVDTSNMYICKNCKSFLGGGDFGTSCSRFYHKLPEPTDDACDCFEWLASRK